jgi:DNA repair ATPase RecN
METTPSVYRFKGVASANKVTTLIVRQEAATHETIAMSSANVELLLSYSRSGDIPKSVRDAIAKAIQLRQSVIDADRGIAAYTQQIGEITAEQNRIRENMKTVAPSTQYYERLLSKLNEQESTIESVQRDRAALIAKRDVARKDLDEYLNTLTID